MTTMKLLFKKLVEAAKLPTRADDGAIGYDLSTVIPVSIPPGSQAVIYTGLAVAIPEGHYGRIAPRSGLAFRYRATVHGGVVDASYRGEVKVLLMNHGHDTIEFDKGDRVAQLICERASTPEPEWADELPKTGRGEKGFGSTGQS